MSYREMVRKLRDALHEYMIEFQCSAIEDKELLAEADALLAKHDYPLPDDLYKSKDWLAGDYAQRVEWLHHMYEAKKQELDVLLAQKEPEPVGLFIDCGSGDWAQYKPAVYEGGEKPVPLYATTPDLQARVEELRTLLRRANHQLSAWHTTYGQNDPDWLPPGGDVQLQEDIDAAIAAQESGK